MMKKTLKLKKPRIGESQVRVISTYDLRDIVGGNGASGGGASDKGLLVAERAGGESS